jgi:hypothetical protein
VPDTSEEEQWRLLEPGQEKPHVVLSAGHIDEGA